MKKIFILIFTLINIAAMAQTPALPLLTGKTDIQKLNDQTAYPWYATNYNSYEPQKTVAVSLKNWLPKEATIMVFGGTRCSDTQNLLPRFYKVLEAAGIDRKQTQLYLLDENKKSPEGLEKQYNIVSVPTFIIMQNGKEIGRVVETVQKDIETDLLQLLQKKQ